MDPFWPRKSPHFARLRAAVRSVAREHPRLSVGLSGGPDSLALAAALAAEKRGEIVAVCVDHQLQEGSRAVSEEAARQARAWGLAAKVVAVDAGRGEAEARVARYRALAAEGGPVCVAHTAEDQAETLLLTALRGQTGGMAPRAEIEGCVVLRPLLEARRADTEGACRELGVEPWRDPHNERADFRRVRIRREVLPLLGDIVGGDAVAPLARAAAQTVDDDVALDTAPTDDCAELAALPAARRRRAIAAWLQASGAPVTGWGIEGIGKLCTDWHGQGGIAVGARLEVRRVGGKLALLHQL